MLKLTIDKHEVLRGLSATAELFVQYCEYKHSWRSSRRVTSGDVRVDVYTLFFQRQQEAMLSQRGRATLCVWIASIQNAERSFIISCVGFTYATAYNSFLFCSLLFGIFVHACCRRSQTNIRWRVADPAIYTAWSSVTVFDTSHLQQSSTAGIRQDRFLSIRHLHSMPPLGRGVQSEY